MELANVAELLGGENVLHKEINSRMDFIELGNRGVSKDALIRLAKYLNVSIKQMAELLAITERTIQRYTLKKKFNHGVSEQILHIAQVAARGTEVFGNKEKFLSWMKQPSKAFADNTPMSLFGSWFGTEMILDELGRIEHGVFS